MICEPDRSRSRWSDGQLMDELRLPQALSLRHFLTIVALLILIPFQLSSALLLYHEVETRGEAIRAQLRARTRLAAHEVDVQLAGWVSELDPIVLQFASDG